MGWHRLQNVYAYRNDNLRRMGYRSYASYLRSPFWRALRAQILASTPQCVKCGATATQVHHRAYDPATLAGECLDALSAVCARCHRRAERPWKPHRPGTQRLVSANRNVLKPQRPDGGTPMGWRGRQRLKEKDEQRAWRKALRAGALSDGTQAPRLVNPAR